MMSKQRTHERLERQHRSEDATMQQQEHQVPESVYEVLATEGQSLDSVASAFMEPRFGHDFSKVRIHADERAAQSAQAVNALAYTVGSDIVFGQGQYAPETQEGKRLLAHELTHTIQQNQVEPSVGDMKISEPASSTESEADSAANAVSLGQPVRVSSGAPGEIARDADPSGGSAPAAAPQQQEPNPNDIWNEIEMRATPELLIKLQEINRQVAVQTKEQIEDLFSPYEDSLESDQTFLSIVSLGLSGAGNAPQTAGWAILAAAATDGVKLIMQKMMDFKSVGEVKKRASSDIGDQVMAATTSDSSTYMNFEAAALDELHQAFDENWSQIPPEQKNLDIARPLFVTWFQMEARTRYGVSSPAGAGVLAGIHDSVSAQLEPVKKKLDDLKEAQRVHRAEAGALGGAVSGAIIGGAIGSVVPVLGTAAGAVVGGVIGGIAGGLGGWFWNS